MGGNFYIQLSEPTLGHQVQTNWDIADMKVMDSFQAQFHIIDGMKTSVEWGPHGGFEGKRNMLVLSPEGRIVYGDAEFYPNKRFPAGQFEAGIYSLIGNFERRGGGYYGNPTANAACRVIVGYWNP